MPPSNQSPCRQQETIIKSLVEKLQHASPPGEALDSQVGLFQQLVQLIPIGIAVHTNGVATFINPAGINIMHAQSAADILGKSAIDFVHPDYREGALKRIQALLERSASSGPNIAPYAEEKFLRLDGDIIDVEVAAFPLSITDEHQAVLVLFRDVTQQKRQQQSLREREERFRVLAETLPAIVFLVDKEGSILYINATAQKLSGYTRDEIMALDYQRIVHPESYRQGIETMNSLALGESANFEIMITNKMGKMRWLDITMTRTTMNAQAVWLGVALDITWKKKAAALLKQQSQQLVSAYEEERARIARELHDEVGQMLIGMKFVLEGAQRSATHQNTLDSLQDARQILAELTENVRELSLSFRPSQLDDLGLIPTLLWHFERYTSRTKIRVAFSHSGFDDLGLSRTIEITLYRLVQESLTNVARHAHTDVVTVTALAQDEVIQLRIQDEGVGFDVEKIQSTHASSGLVGMQERVELLGGTLRIQSRPGAGTILSATIPLAGPTFSGRASFSNE